MPASIPFSVPQPRSQHLAMGSLILIVAFAGQAWSDIFILKNGGRIEGTWMNRDAPQPAKYIVRSEGVEIAVPSANVRRVVESSPAERRYQELLPQMPDSATGNWKMAEWCLSQQLHKLRTRHLEAVIELDPDHEGARRALGYTKTNGQWMRPADIMRARGYVKHKGRWSMPQEVELAKAEESWQATESQWRQDVKRWHGWLGTKRDMDAREQFATLSDVNASSAVAMLLEREQDPQIQGLLIRTLGRLGGSASEHALVRVALTSPSARLRELARDQLLQLDGTRAYPLFLSALKSQDVNQVRRAAFGLQLIGNKEAVRSLIDVLVTRHKFVSTEGGPGSINTAFGSGPTGGGTGFSTGTTTRVRDETIAHAEVLDALKALTGVNHGYNQKAWLTWYSETNSPTNLDLRRNL